MSAQKKDDSSSSEEEFDIYDRDMPIERKRHFQSLFDCNRPVRDDEVQLIADKVQDGWRGILRSLFLDEEVIDDIYTKHNGCIRDVMYDGLLYWKRMLYGIPEVGRLSRVLYRSNKYSVMDELEP